MGRYRGETKDFSEKIVINDDCDCDACASGWLKEKRKAPA